MALEDEIREGLRVACAALKEIYDGKLMVLEPKFQEFLKQNPDLEQLKGKLFTIANDAAKDFPDMSGFAFGVVSGFLGAVTHKDYLVVPYSQKAVREQVEADKKG